MALLKLAGLTIGLPFVGYMYLSRSGLELYDSIPVILVVVGGTNSSPPFLFGLTLMNVFFDCRAWLSIFDLAI